MPVYNVRVDLAFVVQRDRDLVLKAAVLRVIRTRGVHVECVRRFVLNVWVVRKHADLPLACLHVLETALGEIRLAAKATVGKFHRATLFDCTCSIAGTLMCKEYANATANA